MFGYKSCLGNFIKQLQVNDDEELEGFYSASVTNALYKDSSGYYDNFFYTLFDLIYFKTISKLQRYKDKRNAHLN